MHYRQRYKASNMLTDAWTARELTWYQNIKCCIKKKKIEPVSPEFYCQRSSYGVVSWHTKIKLWGWHVGRLTCPCCMESFSVFYLSNVKIYCATWGNNYNFLAYFVVSVTETKTFFLLLLLLKKVFNNLILIFLTKKSFKKQELY